MLTGAASYRRARYSHSGQQDMKIPAKVVNRLTLYHFIIDGLKADEEFVPSTKFAKLLSVDNSQVRKDFKYLGRAGKCRVGYKARELKKSIEEKLGLRTVRNAFIVGAGNLGCALAKYRTFADYGLRILALFDTDPHKIGRVVDGKEIFALSKLAAMRQKMHADIAVLAVPPEHAAEVTHYLAGAGIKYIWNFTPCVLDVPAGVKVWNENLIGSFLQFISQEKVIRQ